MAENTSPKISIIVPVYKVEQYLRRCLDSIASQIFTNLLCDEKKLFKKDYAI